MMTYLHEILLDFFDFLICFIDVRGSTINGLTDRRTYRPPYREVASSEANIPPWAFICSKMLISLVFDESLTDRPTDGQTLFKRREDASKKLKPPGASNLS